MEKPFERFKKHAALKPRSSGSIFNFKKPAEVEGLKIDETGDEPGGEPEIKERKKPGPKPKNKAE